MSESSTHPPQHSAAKPRPNGLAYTYSRQQIAPQMIARVYKRKKETVQRVYTRA